MLTKHHPVYTSFFPFGWNLEPRGMARIDGKNQEVFPVCSIIWPNARRVFGQAGRLMAALHQALLTMTEMPSEGLEGTQLGSFGMQLFNSDFLAACF